MNNGQIDLTGSCEVYCGACPFYQKGTCYGCRSEDKSQRRRGKWRCRIRWCSIKKIKVFFCYECQDFRCNSLTYFQKAHLGDRRFTYREEIIDNLLKIKEIGSGRWQEEQRRAWLCQRCKGRVVFYEYRCLDCGTEVN